jgi:hypothetical protein
MKMDGIKKPIEEKAEFKELVDITRGKIIACEGCGVQIGKVSGGTAYVLDNCNTCDVCAAELCDNCIAETAEGNYLCKKCLTAEKAEPKEVDKLLEIICLSNPLLPIGGIYFRSTEKALDYIKEQIDKHSAFSLGIKKIEVR